MILDQAKLGALEQEKPASLGLHKDTHLNKASTRLSKCCLFRKHERTTLA